MISNLFNIGRKKDTREGKFDENNENNPSFQDLVNRSKENTLEKIFPGDKPITYSEYNLLRSP